MVFYGRDLYAGQLTAGGEYSEAHPVYVIFIVDGILWKDSSQACIMRFNFTDKESGRVLEGTLAIHALELGRYNLNSVTVGNWQPTTRLLVVLVSAWARIRP